MHFKRTRSGGLEDIPFDSSFDSSDFSQIGRLKEDELEFLQARRTRRSEGLSYAPDPRKGDYDEES